MKTTRMASDYATTAAWLLKEAEDALKAENNAICLRRSQEALELAAKGVLRRLAIEYPRQHDVGDAFRAAADRLPEYLKDKTEEIMQALSELDRVRGPAFYGYEAEGIPAGEAFSKEYAEQTLRKVKPLVQLCIKFATEKCS
jgi:HEPN domain-containing protein